MTDQQIKRGEIWWVSLDPTQGSEIKKTRPCVVLSHDTLNRLRRTVVVVPLSTSAKPHPPITVAVTCQRDTAVAVIDQIRAVAKHRLKSRIEFLDRDELDEICRAIATILEIR
ncbi:type II toxin-antitoxin system PemK/MazF family toxin [Desulfonatronum sp. SC1]|uniref:type II toxin-antitoxin system PemK/MazF family toxin n=1 Tax=Desulfonatronum sp. SC1 TaxID=2109626 RepID=UPI0018EE9967|nr:type II toxin-antitoxin system PemK/MazF family toxin [Desulfonatronum sp. SC1]